MEDFNRFWGCFVVYDVIQLLRGVILIVCQSSLSILFLEALGIQGIIES